MNYLLSRFGRGNLARLLLPLGGIIALAGYFGAWIQHPVAGLTVTGLDLAEYVKFLVPVRTGEISLWREGFYAPLVAVSLAWALFAFQPLLRYRWPLRILLLLGATVAALNLLPPAWSPPLLLTPEFRLQSTVMLLCLAAVGVSPFLALLPRRVSAIFTVLMVLPALWLPVRTFLRVLPVIAELYHHPLQPGWGMYVTIGGLLLLGGGASLAALAAKPVPADESNGSFNEQKGMETA